MTVGQTIRQCRKEKGLTQNELALMIGVSMQAVSKWETDSGMPDISQIVPLAKVLGVSTDRLLGMEAAGSAEDKARFHEYNGFHTVSFRTGEAETIYRDSAQYFQSHPTDPEIAFLCLESLTELYAKDRTEKTKEQFIQECERYKNCIFHYETNADQICKTYYVMARIYSLIGDEAGASEMLEKVPVIFGDRTYWEAEYALMDGNTELAKQKCRESFAVKARYIARCIKLARIISESTEGNEGLRYQTELNEYMLRILNAFLSGGDHLPNRQVYQKASLLCQMVGQYAELGQYEKARDCAQQLRQTREDYRAFLKTPGETHCLLFPEDSNESRISLEELDGYVAEAEAKMKACPQD